MALKSRKVILCSRDERTAALFRESWRMAFEMIGIVPVSSFRWGGALRYLLDAIVARTQGHTLVAFGIAEMLFLAPSRPSFGVVTGMGRLADKNNRKSQRCLFLLKLLYRRSSLFVLNKTDLRILRSLGFSKVYLIKGEGFTSRIPHC